jgi:RNA polymerase-binding transcription factor DksA
MASPNGRSSSARRWRTRIETKLGELKSLLTQLERQHSGIVTASLESNADDEHDPEGATIGFERAQLDATIASTSEQVARLKAALERIDAGTYGVCEVCGSAIPEARLEVRPDATRCVQHAS